MLDKLLQYHERPESDEFVLAVMQGVAHQHKLRRLILLLSGLVGAAFGLMGAYWLADPMASLVSLPMFAGNAADYGLPLLLLLGFMAWLLHDEAGFTI